ncbi:DNA repair protein RecN [bacterium endosymbiont of Escarpia laminata]|nr:MAG: DNA repair protein RecN [bacterium endosymbiont of Escarpia laminata]
MLTQIHIRNLAIVAALELDLFSGLSALTGETGAGKSILIDALGLALGGKTDNSMIRSGSERAEITAIFDISALPEIRRWLQDHSLDDENDCLLRRVLSRESRSRAYINGRPVPIQQVQELGQHLVQIHGQHAHQSLLHPHYQRRLLDAYGSHLALTKTVDESFRDYRKSFEQLETLLAAAADHASRLDLLRFQADELSQLDASAAEVETLDRDHKRLSHLERLRFGCGAVIDGLDENEPSLRSQLARLSDELSVLQGLDSNLKEPGEMLASALIQVDEALIGLRDYLSGLELDPESLQQVEARIGALHDMARKYRVNPEKLPQRLQQIQQELSQLENADVELETLSARVEKQREAFLRQAEKLSGKRRQAGKRLALEISAAMQQLGMPGGRFNVTLKEINAADANGSGLEQIEFMVSANPGMPLQPLNKVASGGELSRISLAIQVATIRYGDTPTLVFDEVDVGIGGSVAEIVGQMLRALGESRQILCVTHLPQVAAQALNHLQVQKSTTNELTLTEITPLGDESRIQEIARMLGGIKITEQTLAHAEEMISLADRR